MQTFVLSPRPEHMRAIIHETWDHYKGGGVFSVKLEDPLDTKYSATLCMYQRSESAPEGCAFARLFPEVPNATLEEWDEAGAHAGIITRSESETRGEESSESAANFYMKLQIAHDRTAKKKLEGSSDWREFFRRELYSLASTMGLTDNHAVLLRD